MEFRIAGDDPEAQLHRICELFTSNEIELNKNEDAHFETIDIFLADKENDQLIKILLNLSQYLLSLHKAGDKTTSPAFWLKYLLKLLER